jgi:hypothetical protein
MAFFKESIYCQYARALSRKRKLYALSFDSLHLTSAADPMVQCELGRFVSLGSVFVRAVRPYVSHCQL